MFVPFVAGRYLFSKKRHNTINLVTWVSLAGVAVGTMALVCVLSVMNGFERVVVSSFSAFDPELKIVPRTGMFFSDTTASVVSARQLDDISVWCEIFEADGLLGCDKFQSPAKIKGVADSYCNIAAFDSLIWIGDFTLSSDPNGLSGGVVGLGLAQRINCNPNAEDVITLYAPKNRRVNLARPDANFSQVSFACEGIFCVQQVKYDDNYVILPINTVREVYGRADDLLSAVEIRVSPINQPTDGRRVKRVKQQLAEMLGNDFLVLDRHEQQADFFRISKIEKWTTFMILSFILLVASFNIIGSLSMIIIEKQNDIETLSALGVDRRMMKRLFTAVGFGISLSGCMVGALLGMTIVLLQHYFGFIKMDAGFITQYYPVELHVTDVIAVVVIVLSMGFAAACYTSRRVNDKKYDI